MPSPAAIHLSRLPVCNSSFRRATNSVPARCRYCCCSTADIATRPRRCCAATVTAVGQMSDPANDHERGGRGLRLLCFQLPQELLSWQSICTHRIDQDEEPAKWGGGVG